MLNTMTAPARALAFLALAACTATCSRVDITGPDPGTVHIRLEVTGGIAGVNYAFVVSGAAGEVRAEACTWGCPFEPGTVIVPLSLFQMADLALALERAGVLGYDGADFGQNCCDEFEYRLTYRREGREAVVKGSAGAFPADLDAVLARMRALERGRLPAIVSLTSTPADWPADALTVDDVTIAGSELELTVTYGGGCAKHSIDLVGWNGFLETAPPRLGIAVSHNARSDMCDALISTTRTFDLTPIRDAWRRVYGAGPGTLILLIRDPATGADIPVEYGF